ncbi:MAG: glycosyltransferase family 39 protein [Muribaculaceae bacterium]|nr:glycosyltransferase family 39 protein [Muribaculaceae bacterium]
MISFKKTLLKDHTRVLFFLFMAMGIFARVWKFGIVPGDINPDEAFAGYDAYNLLHYGMDSAGYRFPVYLTTWGSGTSALNTYLMIPFMAVFGAKIWVIRLPQVIVACLTLWVTYLLVKRLFCEKAALCALFLLAISPWHIGMSRWGMDCNMAPGFMIFGLYFFVRGLEDNKYLMLSALMYGLSLYCYATIWPIVPLVVLLQLIYGLACRKIRFDRYLLLSGLILGVLAMPLLLFLLVNMDVIGEIRLPFLSIPRLVVMRGSEVSFSGLPEKARRLWSILKFQSDDMPWNATGKYGIYHAGTLSFFVLGLFYCVKTSVEKMRRSEEAPELLLLIQTGGGVLLGLLVYTNINRNNILFIPMMIVAALGICYLCSLIDLRYLILPAAFYLCMFIGFERYYFTEYDEILKYHFCYGLKDAVKEAVSYDGQIYVSYGLKHPDILFLAQVPVTEFIETVEYYNYPDAYLETRSFSRFSYDFDPTAPDTDATYILSQSVDTVPFEQTGFTLHTYGFYTVAHCPQESKTPQQADGVSILQRSKLRGL